MLRRGALLVVASLLCLVAVACGGGGGGGDGGVGGGGQAGTGGGGGAGCPAQLQGPYLLALADVNINPGVVSYFFKLHYEDQYDQKWLRVLFNGLPVLLKDFARIGDTALVATDGTRWWLANLPSSSATELELGAPLDFPAGSPPQTEYLALSNNPILARTASLLYEVDYQNGRWRPLGGVGSPASSCGIKRDFLTGRSHEGHARWLANCGTTPNQVVHSSWDAGVDGGLVSSSELTTDPELEAIPGQVLGRSDQVIVSSNHVYVGGVDRRTLRECAAGFPNGVPWTLRSLQ